MTEDNSVIEPVEEFRSEHTFDLFVHTGLHRFIVRIAIGSLETKGRLVLDRLGAGIRGHDHDRVAEIHIAAKAISQPAFFHNLQQHVEDIWMGLFNFIEQDYGVGPAADLLSQLATFLVTDVAGRCTDQATDIVLLHVFTHIDVNQGIGITKHEFSQCLSQQRLTDTCRSGEDETACWPLGILQATTATTYRLGDCLDCSILAHDPFVQVLFHAHQPQAVLG